MYDKEYILNKLKELKPLYEDEGLVILGLFGSYAKNVQTDFSDIDVAYSLDYNKFSKKYNGGFEKLLRIEDIKKDLEKEFHTKVDLIPDTNKKIIRDLIHV